MSDSEIKDVTVRENNTSHLSELLGIIFDGIRSVHSMNVGNERELRIERLEMFYNFKHDYEVAQRSRLFLGMTSTRQVLNESNDYALNQMKRIFREINNTGDEHIDRFIKLAIEAPKEFLEAVMSVFQGVKSGTSPQLVPGDNKAPDLIDFLSKFERQGKDDRDPVKEKRRNFGRAFEEES